MARRSMSWGDPADPVKRTAVAQPSVVDQEIDLALLAIKPCQQLLQLHRISKIGFANVNEKLWLRLVQLIS